jgi:hypothetical protein
VSARTRVVAVIVVAALVALSAATLLGILLSGGSGGSGDSESLGGSQPSAPAAAEPELTLVLPARAPGRCAAFSVDVLSGAEQAFSGTAVTVDDREAVLQVDHWYRGGDADLVRLATGDMVARGLVEGLGFTEGERYLVTADAGVVTPCGYSAPWSPAMARAYAQAFEG